MACGSLEHFEILIPRMSRQTNALADLLSKPSQSGHRSTVCMSSSRGSCMKPRFGKRRHAAAPKYAGETFSLANRGRNTEEDAAADLWLIRGSAAQWVVPLHLQRLPYLSAAARLLLPNRRAEGERRRAQHTLKECHSWIGKPTRRIIRRGVPRMECEARCSGRDDGRRLLAVGMYHSRQWKIVNGCVLLWERNASERRGEKGGQGRKTRTE